MLYNKNVPGIRQMIGGREMTTIYRIHGNDYSGNFSFDCYSYEEYKESWNNLKEDPEVDDLWLEEYDEEEGWQA